MKIPYVNLSRQYHEERSDLIKIFDKVLKSGNYVGGDFIKKFENNVAKYCGIKILCKF
jgi:dTDP-4-amino-4,6-dideoxygalactose transaminase